jgi:ankyrin repeat protein
MSADDDDEETTSTMTIEQGRAWLNQYNYNTAVSRSSSGKFPVYTACGMDFFDKSEDEKFGPMSEEENCVVVGTEEWHEYVAYKENRKKETKGSFAALKWLLKNGAADDISAVTPEGNTPFRLACYNGNLPIVKFLFAKGAQGDVSKPNKKGSKPMSAACYEGHIHIVKFLLECGCQEDLPGAQYHSTSHMTLAAQNGHVELMEFLYDNGCKDDVLHVDDRGMVPMMYAAQQENMEVMEFLFTHGAAESIHHCRPHDGVSTLGAAIASARLSTVKWFVDHGASTSQLALVSKQKVTPMIIAAQGNGGVINDGTAKSYLDIMKYLYENGAADSITQAMDDGSTPLHYVAYNGDVETARWMKEVGVDFSAETKDSRTPMLCAAMTGAVEMLDYFYYNDEGCAKNDLLKLYFGQKFTLLHAAATKGSLRAVKWLVERLPSQYSFRADKTGSDPFLHACRNNHLDVANYFYQRFGQDVRFNIHRKNIQDDGAMIFAVENNNVEMLDFLYGIGITEVTKPIKHNCITLLQIACKCCHLEVMKWLAQKNDVRKLAPHWPYMGARGDDVRNMFAGKGQGPSFMHTMLTTNFFATWNQTDPNEGPLISAKQAKQHYGKSVKTQKGCLHFCHEHGATLNDMSMPFPDPMSMMARGSGDKNKSEKGHIPLGMVIVNVSHHLS